MLITCIVISTGSFVWGYWQAGYEEVSRWLITFGVFWLLTEWRKWKWYSAPAILFCLFLAVYGVWYKLSFGWMFNGAAFGTFAWNFVEFRRKLRFLPPRENKDEMTKRHIVRVGLLMLISLIITIFLLAFGGK